jgi:hypothetical protein
VSKEEKVFSEHANGSTITKAEYLFDYSGSLQGKGELMELKNYASDGNVSIVGMERITGTLGEKKGSFVLQHEGSIKEGIISTHRQVLYGSGTEELAGIRGNVKFESEQAKSFFMFNYSLD